MADSINKDLGRDAARSIDSREIDLEVTPGEDIPALLARVEAVQVPFYPRAKVVVNERTGTVVIGGMVVLQPGQSAQWKVRLELFSLDSGQPPI